MTGKKLLVVDDEQTQREMLAAILGRAGFDVTTAGDGNAAIELLKSGPYDLLLTDQRMPGMDGLELLDRARGIDGKLPIVLMTAFGSVQSAVAAMKRGADDYLTKPFERDELLLVLDKVLRQRRLEDEVTALRGALEDRYSLGNIIGRSPAMQEVFSLIERVGHTDVPVLLRGESGTGKEMVARAIHQSGPRSKKSLVALNCAAVPEGLLESEFFGHERGAFTGATQTHIGRFEQAHGGTLFLDEIGSMRFDLQAKLLRAIQEGEVQRLGSKTTIKVDVRIVAATSEDLEELIRKKEFRDDLYYRLNVIPIELPPLRERADDIPLLLDRFLDTVAKRLERKPLGVTPGALERMQRYHWPGNVRELSNLVERVTVLTRGTEITEADLPAVVREGVVAADDATGAFELPSSGVSLPGLERQLIAQAMKRTRGSIAAAAKLLGISYKTLQYRLRKHNLDGHS